MTTFEVEPLYSQRVVSIGGGSGQFNLLRGLVKLNSPELTTAIPGTWDSGGSSGRLRTDLGSLPVGDVRQCLIALMESERQQLWVMRQSDNRFRENPGPLKGHDLLNLDLDMLIKLAGGFQQGIDAFREKYLIRGNVYPSSLLPLDISVKLQNSDEIDGESLVDSRFKDSNFDPNNRIVKVRLNTRAEANFQALQAIGRADKIIFSSGSLWTSVVPHLHIQGFAEAMMKSEADVIVVQNLVTEQGQTDFFTSADHLREIARYLPNRINYLIVNQNSISDEALSFYEQFNQRLIVFDEDKCLEIVPQLKFVRANLATYLDKPDLLRHDPLLLAKVVLEPENFVNN